MFHKPLNLFQTLRFPGRNKRGRDGRTSGTGSLPRGSIVMSGGLESKLKTAMDESRLLILGAQVLFGFQFQAAFQELFEELGEGGRAVHCVSLALLLITIGCLIAPASIHQIVYGGES